MFHWSIWLEVYYITWNVTNQEQSDDGECLLIQKKILKQHPFGYPDTSKDTCSYRPLRPNKQQKSAASTSAHLGPRDFCDSGSESPSIGGVFGASHQWVILLHGSGNGRYRHRYFLSRWMCVLLDFVLQLSEASTVFPYVLKFTSKLFFLKVPCSSLPLFEDPEQKCKLFSCLVFWEDILDSCWLYASVNHDFFVFVKIKLWSTSVAQSKTSPHSVFQRNLK